MKKIDLGVFENTHMTICWRPKNLESAQKKIIFKIWLYQSTEHMKRSKSYKKTIYWKQIIQKLLRFKYFSVQGGNWSEDFS